MTKAEIESSRVGGLLIQLLQNKIASQEEYIRQLEAKLSATAPPAKPSPEPARRADDPQNDSRACAFCEGRTWTTVDGDRYMMCPYCWFTTPAKESPAPASAPAPKPKPFNGLTIGQRVMVTLTGSPYNSAPGTVMGFQPVGRNGGYTYLVEVCIESADGLGQFRGWYFPEFLVPVERV